MSIFHRYLGAVIVVLFLVIFLWGIVSRLLRQEEPPVGLLAVQHWTENLLLVQTVVGIVLLLIGRRIVGMPAPWLHYLYGSLFPLVAIIAGRIASLRRERYAQMGLAWGAFFAVGLTLRSLQMGCGETPRAIGRCLGLDV